MSRILKNRINFSYGLIKKITSVYQIITIPLKHLTFKLYYVF